MALSEEQVARYARQILLPQVGGKGQERLLAAVVRLHGTGVAAQEAATYLAAAGLGALILDPEFPAEPRARLGQLGPDLKILMDVKPDRVLSFEAGSQRIDGALQAMEAVVLLTGAAPAMRWSLEGSGLGDGR